MIGRLAGRVLHRGMDHVMLDVGGVGYIVQVSERTLRALPGVGEAAALWTEMIVREDAMTLVGFPTLVEKEWHRLLTSVQGVGAKAAMAILGTLGPEATGRAIALGDWSAIKAAPGVGPKIAQRVVNELKDKAPSVMALPAEAPPPMPAAGGDPVVVEPAAPFVAPSPGAQAEAMSALANLGYGPSDAARAVAEALDEAPDADTGNLIRLALKRLAPGG